MTSSNLKEFIRTPKGKLSLALCAMLLSWAFLLVSFAPSMSGWLPDEPRRKQLNEEIASLDKEYKSLKLRLKDNDDARRKYKLKTASAWQFTKDGDPEILLRQIIENAAKTAELKMQNTGSVGVSRINDALYYAEIDLSATGDLEKVVKFIGNIRSVKPEISWRRMMINPMFRRQQNNSTTRSSIKNGQPRTADTQATQVFFNGALRVIVYDGDKAEAAVSVANSGDKK